MNRVRCFMNEPEITASFTSDAAGFYSMENVARKKVRQTKNARAERRLLDASCNTYKRRPEDRFRFDENFFFFEKVYSVLRTNGEDVL